jgi:hypothetical protein
MSFPLVQIQHVTRNLTKQILEKFIVVQLVKKFLGFYRTQRYITVFRIAHTGPYLEPDETSLNLIDLRPLELSRGFFHPGFQAKSLYSFLIFP